MASLVWTVSLFRRAPYEVNREKKLEKEGGKRRRGKRKGRRGKRKGRREKRKGRREKRRGRKGKRREREEQEVVRKRMIKKLR